MSILWWLPGLCFIAPFLVTGLVVAIGRMTDDFDREDQS